ncbi:hypothetical protein [Pararhizobium sp. IMCC21322]|uniref:hypothetical protein n=1 Tax=Pararhizobium sp. IMCC21322 TaxID=3067903 RepID=UPI00274143E1|nr:hypothetical protein [Pararhizobium sp. IMCC21322]
MFIVSNNLIDNYNLLNEDKPNIIRGAMNADLEEVKAALLENPDCINEADPETGLTAMHIGGGEGDYALVDLLCNQPGFDISLRDAWGRTPYLMARVIGRQDIIDRMFEQINAEISRRLELEDSETEDSASVTHFRPRRPPSGPS